MRAPQIGYWNASREPGAWRRFDSIRVAQAAERILGVAQRTPLAPFDAGDPRLELRLKLENRQSTGAFKARGAWNQISMLAPESRARGVVCTSSGNHGGALAWAAQRAGVPAVIVMPKDAYPNKIAACRERGAEVVLCDDRASAEAECARRVEAGATLVHPYDAERTIQGAGTVGMEIAQDWPEVEVVVVPVGGGGLVSGTALGARQFLREEHGDEAAGERLRVLGAEPEGAPTLTIGLRTGSTEPLTHITSRVQGLTPPNAGRLNVDVCRVALDGTFLLDDETIVEAQGRLVRAGEIVEPAGAAAFALVIAGGVPEEWLEHRDFRRPLRVCAVVSGGNPDPAQLARLQQSP